MNSELLPSPREVYVFTDGACSGNPGPGGWAAVIVFQEPTSKNFFIRELGGHAENTTNNRMELLSISKAIDFLDHAGKNLIIDCNRIVIFSDSSYSLKGLEEWLPGWKRKDWKTLEGGEVKNRDLWELLDAQLSNWRSRSGNSQLIFKKVKGHSGNPGNERVDKIAVAWSQWREEDPTPMDRSGAVPTDWLKPRMDPASAEQSLSQRFPQAFSQKFPFYASYLQGEFKTFGTWKECEAHVRGRGQAKYQKIASREQLLEVLVKWGLN